MWRAVLLTLAIGGVFSAGCSSRTPEPLRVEKGQLIVDNQTDSDWAGVEIWINRYFRVTAPSIAARSRFEVPLNAFVSGYAQRFDRLRTPIDDLRLTAIDSRGQPIALILRPPPVGLAALGGKK